MEAGVAGAARDHECGKQGYLAWRLLTNALTCTFQMIISQIWRIKNQKTFALDSPHRCPISAAFFGPLHNAALPSRRKSKQTLTLDAGFRTSVAPVGLICQLLFGAVMTPLPERRASHTVVCRSCARYQIVVIRSCAQYSAVDDETQEIAAGSSQRYRSNASMPVERSQQSRTSRLPSSTHAGSLA